MTKFDLLAAKAVNKLPRKLCPGATVECYPRSPRSLFATLPSAERSFKMQIAASSCQTCSHPNLLLQTNKHDVY